MSMSQHPETEARIQPRPLPPDGPVTVQPGDEFIGAGPDSLLGRLRLDPSLGVVDAMQTSLTVYVDEAEIDLGGEQLFGSLEMRRLFTSEDGDAFGYVVEQCGDWVHEWAEDAVDRYTYWDRATPLREVLERLISESELGDLIWADTSTQTWYPFDEGAA